MSYIASSDVHAYGGIPDTDTVDDTAIGLLIVDAQAIVDLVTGRTFSASSDGVARSLDYETHCADAMLLLDADLCRIDSITVGATALSSSDYFTLPKNETPYYAVKIKDISGLTWSDADSDGSYEYAISITGAWAYSETPPADIKHAMLRLVQWLYFQSRQSPAEGQPTTILPSGITIMPSRLPTDVQDILGRYRLEMVV